VIVRALTKTKLIKSKNFFFKEGKTKYPDAQKGVLWKVGL
jgi:hypothetical protein